MARTITDHPVLQTHHHHHHHHHIYHHQHHHHTHHHHCPLHPHFFNHHYQLQSIVQLFQCKLFEEHDFSLFYGVVKTYISSRYYPIDIRATLNNNNYQGNTQQQQQQQQLLISYIDHGGMVSNHFEITYLLISKYFTSTIILSTYHGL